MYCGDLVMKVIKLGGSLLSSGQLARCLSLIVQYYQNNVVIVAGGGVFAEQVRKAQLAFQFDDYYAHAMALLAMQQTAWLIKGLEPRFVLADSVETIKHTAKQNIVVWLPDLNELNNANIPATWAVTSDSLAAWLAKTLSAEELLLVKSAEIDRRLSVAELAERGIVDAAFCQMTTDVAVRVINYRVLQHTVTR
jgi:5-(aminomethyl)-3-furanmethanol phosphate kinase